MHILLIYPGGRQEHGLLLAGSARSIRITMPDRADAMEFCLVEGAWVAESGAVIEIGAMAACETSPSVRFEDAPRPQARRAVA